MVLNFPNSYTDFVSNIPINMVNIYLGKGGSFLYNTNNMCWVILFSGGIQGRAEGETYPRE